MPISELSLLACAQNYRNNCLEPPDKEHFIVRESSIYICRLCPVFFAELHRLFKLVERYICISKYSGFRNNGACSAILMKQTYIYIACPDQQSRSHSKDVVRIFLPYARPGKRPYAQAYGVGFPRALPTVNRVYTSIWSLLLIRSPPTQSARSSVPHANVRHQNASSLRNNFLCF